MNRLLLWTCPAIDELFRGELSQCRNKFQQKNNDLRNRACPRGGSRTPAVVLTGFLLGGLSSKAVKSSRRGRMQAIVASKITCWWASSSGLKAGSLLKNRVKRKLLHLHFPKNKYSGMPKSEHSKSGKGRNLNKCWFGFQMFGFWTVGPYGSFDRSVWDL